MNWQRQRQTMMWYHDTNQQKTEATNSFLLCFQIKRKALNGCFFYGVLLQLLLLLFVSLLLLLIIHIYGQLL